MYVIKRNGEREVAQFEKITKRIEHLSGGLDKDYVDPSSIAQKVIAEVKPGIHTSELDEIAARVCIGNATQHTDFSILAGRLCIDNLHKNTPGTVEDYVKVAMEHRHHATDLPVPLLGEEEAAFLMEHKDRINKEIDFERDFNIKFFGFKTLEKSYLLRTSDNVVFERPQFLYMREAVQFNLEGSGTIEDVIETYFWLSEHYYTHATPTMFNAGTPKPQMSSCYVLYMKGDSIEGIYDTLKDCACISKFAGGIGLAVHRIRGAGSYIAGTQGYSNGLVPMLTVFNNTARYVDQCFAPPTIVYTERGPTPIAEISLGDRVITNDGSFQRVNRIIPHTYEGNMVDISTKHSFNTVSCTPEHPFLTLKNQKKGLNFSVIRNRLEKKILVPDYVEAKHLSDNDFIGYPIPTFVHDEVTFSNDDCRMLGIMIGDGHISKDDRQCSITLHSVEKQKTFDFATMYLSNNGIRPTITKRSESLTRRITWTQTMYTQITRSMLYDNRSEKIVPTFVLHLPDEKIKCVLRGILETDGTIGDGKGKEVYLEMTSLEVIESVRYMLLRLGVLTGGYVRDRVGESHTVRKTETITCRKKSFVLRIPKVPVVCDILGIERGKYVNFLVHGGIAYSRVTSANLKESEGTVYDLEIDNNHNYLTHGGLAHNGGGKRKGSFAIYLEPWHPDIMDFLELKRNHGKEERRARDLHYAMWVPNLFMQRVEEDGDWSLFCPSKTPSDLKPLPEIYGKEFEDTYLELERRGLAVKTLKAQQVYDKIIDLQTETGEPYFLFKDHFNNKSNQKNIGIIHSSNLCTEIALHTSAEETAVCNLASIALPRFVEDGVFNTGKLVRVARLATRNTNRVIEKGFYPTVEARRSNMRHRPVGVGVQGLADTFILMRLPFDSEEAKALNREIFEAIYYGCCLESCEEAKKKGPYETFAGSPLSEGKFQFDLWIENGHDVKLCGKFDWDSLRKDIMTYGVRNSTLVALMPTASTAQIMDNTEGFEPITTNVMNRRVLAGEFPVLNKHLLKDLVSMGIWNNEVRLEIMRNGGSIQSIPQIPDKLKDLYKTVWEIRQSQLMIMAAERGPFVCQSQSLNIHMEKATTAKVATHHMKAWKAGLKTSLYYLRTKGHVMQNKFTVRHSSATGITPDTIGTTPLKIHSGRLLPPPPPVSSERLEEGEDICLNCGS